LYIDARTYRQLVWADLANDAEEGERIVEAEEERLREAAADEAEAGGRGPMACLQGAAAGAMGTQGTETFRHCWSCLRVRPKRNAPADGSSGSCPAAALQCDPMNILY
jgi:hypothetical protein